MDVIAVLAIGSGRYLPTEVQVKTMPLQHSLNFSG